MEHYFIYLYHGLPTPEENQLVINYIKSLLPNSKTLNCFDSGCLSAPLLKCSPVYLSVINTLFKEKNLEWEKLSSDHLLKDTITKSSQDAAKSCDEENGNLDQILASSINALADQLPPSGSYKLDVVVNYSALKNFSVSTHIEFTGSLYRLHKWHDAHIVFVTPDGVDNLISKDWYNILEAEYLKQTDTQLGVLIWRGSIQFHQSNAAIITDFPGFQMRLDPFANETCGDEMLMNVDNREEAQSEYLITSSFLQIMDECSFASIPPYMFAPARFKLCHSKPRENSRTLLHYFIKKEGAALIVRMNYTVVADKPKPDKSLSTSKWQKMVSSGNIKIPESCCLPKPDKYISFAITKQHHSSNLLVYPLRDPSSINAHFYFTLMSSASKVKSAKRKQKTSIEVPYISEPVFHTLVNKMNVTKLNQNGKDAHSELLSVLKSVQTQGSENKIILQPDCEIISEEVDPADWAERMYLLQKQTLEEKEKKITHSNIFFKLSPRQPQYNVCFSAENATKLFLSTGEAKDVTKGETITLLNGIKKLPKLDYETLMHTKWPEVLNFTHDGMYYNSNKQAEEKEYVGNEMVRFYVQQETASCCNRQQLITDSVIPIRTKSQPVRNKWRSPAKKSPRKQNIKTQHSLSETNTNSFNTSNNRSLLSAKRLNSTANLHKTVNVISKPLKKSDVKPVRCSPRKKTHINYSYPSSSRDPRSSKVKHVKSQELPDKVKKKLRYAVATALEKNDIQQKSDFFLPCFKKLFTICQAFVQDISVIKGSKTEHLQKIADDHVKPVIEFEKQKKKV